jgi:hypothetical protein
VRIAFVGVGMMGRGMAKNLLEKGFPTTVVGHRNRAPVDELVAKGAREARTPADAATDADVKPRNAERVPLLALRLIAIQHLAGLEESAVRLNSSPTTHVLNKERYRLPVLGDGLSSTLTTAVPASSAASGRDHSATALIPSNDLVVVVDTRGLCLLAEQFPLVSSGALNRDDLSRECVFDVGGVRRYRATEDIHPLAVSSTLPEKESGNRNEEKTED